MDPGLVKQSKFLALVLRHDPAAAGLTLDANGWADVQAVLDGVGRRGLPMTRESLEEAVATNDKRRYELSADGARVRARQGHSVDVDLQLTPVRPPELLFHGTADRFVAAIRAEGLRPGARQYVHLSADQATAVAVGARHGHPVVLTVAAGRMHAAGHEFFLSTNGVWLTASVPPQYLQGGAAQP